MINESRQQPVQQSWRPPPVYSYPPSYPSFHQPPLHDRPYSPTHLFNNIPVCSWASRFRRWSTARRRFVKSLFARRMASLFINTYEGIKTSTAGPILAQML